MSTTTTTDPKAQSKELRLKGNQEFSAGNWEEALELYEQSNAFFETAKCYSNIAATLCKLGWYEEASQATMKCTDLDPTWAKGWWRRGLVCELKKNLMLACKYYAKAVELDGEDKTFKKSLRNAEKQAKVHYNKDGTRMVEATQGIATEHSPAARAWKQANARIGCHFTIFRRSYDIQNEKSTNPSSEQWLVKGMDQWIGGMKSAIAQMAVSISSEAQEAYASIRMQSQVMRLMSPGLHFEWDAMDEALGGVPQNGVEMYELTSAIAHLGGVRHLFLETAGKENRSDYFCAPPAVFGDKFSAYQTIAVLWSVVNQMHNVHRTLGPTLKCSQGVLQACVMAYANINGSCPWPIRDINQAPTPQEIVEYMKELLQKGVMDWEDESLRDYVSCQYRGNILFGSVMALVGLLADAHTYLKWANDFIKLVDEEFQVSQEKDYEKYGSAFKPSLRAGIVMGLYDIHNTLQNQDFNGPYSMEQSMELLVEISEMAHRYPEVAHEHSSTEYERIESEAVYQCKPLAMAHSNIAANLNTLAPMMDLKDFKMMAKDFGFIEDENAPCDPFGLVAKHYGIAAENELFDAEDCAIYWWAHGGSIARANPAISKYTLGQLRRAIAMGEAAEEARNTALFGENLQRGGSYENLAKVVALHYRNEPDSFVLPSARIVYGEGDQKSICIGEEVICEKFHEFSAADQKWIDSKQHPRYKIPDTSKLVEEYGRAPKAKIPKLETLCVRELHHSGAEFAAGETDGDVVHQKAMRMAAEAAEQMAE